MDHWYLIDPSNGAIINALKDNEGFYDKCSVQDPYASTEPEVESGERLSTPEERKEKTAEYMLRVVKTVYTLTAFDTKTSSQLWNVTYLAYKIFGPSITPISQPPVVQINYSDHHPLTSRELEEDLEINHSNERKQMTDQSGAQITKRSHDQYLLTNPELKEEFGYKLSTRESFLSDCQRGQLLLLNNTNSKIKWSIDLTSPVISLYAGSTFSSSHRSLLKVVSQHSHPSVHHVQEELIYPIDFITVSIPDFLKKRTRFRIQNCNQNIIRNGHYIFNYSVETHFSKPKNKVNYPKHAHKDNPTLNSNSRNICPINSCKKSNHFATLPEIKVGHFSNEKISREKVNSCLRDWDWGLEPVAALFLGRAFTTSVVSRPNSFTTEIPKNINRNGENITSHFKKDEITKNGMLRHMSKELNDFEKPTNPENPRQDDTFSPKKEIVNYHLTIADYDRPSSLSVDSFFALPTLVSSDRSRPLAKKFLRQQTRPISMIGIEDKSSKLFPTFRKSITPQHLNQNGPVNQKEISDTLFDILRKIESKPVSDRFAETFKNSNSHLDSCNDKKIKRSSIKHSGPRNSLKEIDENVHDSNIVNNILDSQKLEEPAAVNTKSDLLSGRFHPFPVEVIPVTDLFSSHYSYPYPFQSSFLRSTPLHSTTSDQDMDLNPALVWFHPPDQLAPPGAQLALYNKPGNGVKSNGYYDYLNSYGIGNNLSKDLGFYYPIIDGERQKQNYYNYAVSIYIILLTLAFPFILLWHSSVRFTQLALRFLPGIIRVNMHMDLGKCFNEISKRQGRLVKIGKIVCNTERVLGYGSFGTVVYEGTFENRKVGVKRLLILDNSNHSHSSNISDRLTSQARREVRALIRCDRHDHVIRYFVTETLGDFIYIALELCMVSFEACFKANNLLDCPLKPYDSTTGPNQNGFNASLPINWLSDWSDSGHVGVEKSISISQFHSDGHVIRSCHAGFNARSIDQKDRQMPENDKSKNDEQIWEDVLNRISARELCSQMLSGLSHLHSHNIVHRDLKPSNILITFSDSQNRIRAVISDFGISANFSSASGSNSWASTSGAGGGTLGWNAPEILRKMGDSDGKTNDYSSDLFSAGCVMFYVITRGCHPFGGTDPFERQINILSGKCDLKQLSHQTNDDICLRHLLNQMLSTDPQMRPLAKTCINHPYFWTDEKRLQYLLDLSDLLEKADSKTELVKRLEKYSTFVLEGGDWKSRIDSELSCELRKYRNYRTDSVRDLLRALRNKKHHYQELPDTLKLSLGPIPGKFLEYFTSRFPYLLIHLYTTYQTLMNHKNHKDIRIFDKYF
ncbi:unnamed protein product [Gordionus sp. m RMFG-2023]